METKTRDFQEEYLQKSKHHKRTVQAARVLILALFLGLWEAAADLGWIDSFFFSSPSLVVRLFLRQCLDRSIFLHIGITLFETIASFFLVLILSLSIATLLWRFGKLSEILEPYLVVLNSLPKSALAPLFIVWLGTGTRTIIVAGISVAVFGSILSFYTGFLQCDPEKLMLIYTLGGSRSDAFKKVVLPSSVPILLATSKVNIGLSLVGVIIGEFLAARRGLGYLIIYGSQVFQLNQVIMSILILCLIATALYRILQFVEKRAGRP